MYLSAIFSVVQEHGSQCSVRLHPFNNEHHHPPAITSSKVCVECACIITPQIMRTLISVQSLMYSLVYYCCLLYHIFRNSYHFNKETYVDFVAVQIKFLSFLAYIIRIYQVQAVCRSVSERLLCHTVLVLTPK